MKSNTNEVAKSIAQLMPSIIQGAQLNFLSESSVTHSQFFVLVSLYSLGDCSMSVLAEKMHIRMPTATGLAERLTRSGYITRISNPNDRRSVIVRLTSKGEMFIKTFQKTIQARWDEVLKNLNENELTQMHEIINKLKTELQKQTP